MLEIETLKTKFLRLQTEIELRKKIVEEQRNRVETELKEAKASLVVDEQVKEVLKKLSLLARRGNITKVEALVTYALQTILDEPSYKFFIDAFESNSTVVYDFKYEHFGLPAVRMARGSGGGIKDIVSTFLSIIIPVLLDPKARRFVVLDERFKHLSDSHLPRVAKTIKLLAEKLDMQFLLITQQEELASSADRVYHFFNQNGVTQCRTI